MFEKHRYFKDTNNVHLTADEKLSVQQKLNAFIQAHPVRVSSAARQIGQEAHPNFLSSLKSMMLKPLPITLSALLVLGGGTAFAAEQSLPNEALYPVKIQVNERIRATLTPTTEAKAKWEVRVAERRLEEAEKLALEKKFTVETQAQVETTFDEQAKLIQEKIALLKAEGNIDAAIELSSSFQASLKAHEAILTQLDARNEDTTAIDPLLEKIKLNTAVVSSGIVDLGTNTNTNLDTQAELKLMAQKKQQSAADAIAQAKQSFSASTNLNAELKAKVTTVLSVANEELSKGNEQFNQAEFKLALSHYEQAESYAQEVLILIKTSQVLKLETLPLLPDIKFDAVKPASDIPSTDTKIDTDADVKVDTQTQIKVIPKSILQETIKVDPSILEPKTDPTIDKTGLDAQTQLDTKVDTSIQDKANLDLGL